MKRCCPAGWRATDRRPPNSAGRQPIRGRFRGAAAQSAALHRRRPAPPRDACDQRSVRPNRGRRAPEPAAQRRRPTCQWRCEFSGAPFKLPRPKNTGSKPHSADEFAAYAVYMVLCSRTQVLCNRTPVSLSTRFNDPVAPIVTVFRHVVPTMRLPGSIVLRQRRRAQRMMRAPHVALGARDLVLLYRPWHSSIKLFTPNRPGSVRANLRTGSWLARTRAPPGSPAVRARSSAVRAHSGSCPNPRTRTPAG